jgi:hypothetical protein
MLPFVGWRLLFAGALHTASSQPWPGRRLSVVTSLGQQSCRKLPGGCGGKAASASAAASPTVHQHQHQHLLAASASASPTVEVNYPRLPCGNVALDCPFINSKHRCVQGQFGCGTQSILPPVVGAASCSTYWSSSEFTAALGGRSLYFFGDSLAAQQWKSLLCAEAVRLTSDSRAAVAKATSENTPKNTCGVLRWRAPSGLVTARVCYQRTSSTAAALQSATQLVSHAGSRDVLLLSSAPGHEANLTQTEAVRRLVAWRQSVSLPSLTRVVWRTQEASHYGERGWQGVRETRGCHPLSTAQRERLLSPLAAADFDALRRANVASFNGAAATVDAHTAHPLRCGPPPFYDCRHFCQPGPVDAWNAQLIRLLLSWNETKNRDEGRREDASRQGE